MNDFNFFSLKLEKFGDDTDVHRRVYIVHFTMSLGIIFLLFLGAVALYEKNVPLAITDYLIALTVILNLVYLHNTKRINVSIFIGIIMTASFFFWLLVYGGVGQTAFVWYYTFPLFSVFVLGPKKGTVMAIILIAAAIVFFLLDDYFPNMAQYPMDFKIRFVPSYLTVALFSYLSENFRDNAQVKLKMAYDTMEHRVQERTAELQEKNEQLQLVSQTDALTGLKNRMKLDEILQHEIALAERYPERTFCIILMDLDHFKSVNDNFGHIAGDQVLVRFAGVLKKNTRSTDTLGRWGGEEFLMICPSMGLDNIYILAEKLRRAICDETFPIVEKLTTSIGITCYHKGDNINSIVKRADKALYEAKEERNVCCVCSEE